MARRTARSDARTAAPRRGTGGVLSAVVVAAGLALGGCAALQPQDAFGGVRASLADRGGLPAVWATGVAEDSVARVAVDSLLGTSLTADAAVQVALLNNRRLQATYEDLGVAQAQVVQAGLLKNPVFGGRSPWPTGGGPPDLGITVAFDFLNVFTRALRRRLARSAFAGAEARVTGRVLDVASRVRAAAARAQADAARLEARRRVAATAEAGATAARLLYASGTAAAIDTLRERALYEQARLDLLDAEADAVESREALVRLMGLAEGDARAVPAGGLPAVPAASPLPYLRAGTADGMPTAEVDVAALEEAALAASLDLAAARADIEAGGQRLGVTRVEALVPDLPLGGGLGQMDGAARAGPELEFTLPLFDTGQGARAANRAELRRAQALYEAVAVDVRSAARTLTQRLVRARRAALHHQATVLPLHAAVAAETLRRYRARQATLFDVLEAQRAEAEAQSRALDATAAYWEARADLDLLLQGCLPRLDGSGLARRTSGGPSPS